MQEDRLCDACQQHPANPAYRKAFCDECRTKLAQRPLPNWIRISMLALIPILVLALCTSPRAFGAGIAFERGQQAERNHNYARAEQLYRGVAQTYPDSTLALARYGIAAYYARDVKAAAQALRQLAGRKANAALVTEVNQIIKQLKGKK